MSDYLLGHEAREWDRLADQHALWGPRLLATLQRHGLSPGARVLDVGCGNGTLLADLVEAGAQAVGIERDPAAAAQARHHAPVLTGDLGHVDLPGDQDLIVVRWVFSFLPDVGAAVARLTRALRPGGRLVVQDYIHDGLGFYPPDPALWRCVDAVRSAYRDSGGNLWVAGRLPEHFIAAGLRVDQVLPEADAGPPDSAVFRWVERFLLEHAPNLVAQGHMSADEHAAFLSAWARFRATPGALLVSPLQVTAVGRRP